MRSAAGGPCAVLTGPCQPHPESSPSPCWSLLAGLWALLGPGLGQVAPLHCSVFRRCSDYFKNFSDYFCLMFLTFELHINLKIKKKALIKLRQVVLKWDCGGGK